MKMPQLISRQKNCLHHIVFFNIHMKGIQHDLHRIHIHFFYKLPAFRTGIEQITFKAVQHLQTVIHAAFPCDLPYPTHILNAPGPVSHLVDGFTVIYRPVRVNSSSQCVNIQNLQFLQNIRVESHCVSDNLPVRAGQILPSTRSVSGRQSNTRILRPLLHLLQFPCRDLFQHRAGDLQHIKSQLFYLLDVLLLVHIPFLLPISKINTIFHFTPPSA